MGVPTESLVSEMAVLMVAPIPEGSVSAVPAMRTVVRMAAPTAGLIGAQTAGPIAVRMAAQTVEPIAVRMAALTAVPVAEA